MLLAHLELPVERPYTCLFLSHLFRHGSHRFLLAQETLLPLGEGAFHRIKPLLLLLEGVILLREFCLELLGDGAFLHIEPLLLLLENMFLLRELCLELLEPLELLDLVVKALQVGFYLLFLPLELYLSK